MLSPITIVVDSKLRAEALLLLVLCVVIGAAALYLPEPATRLAAATRDLARFLILAFAAFHGFMVLVVLRFPVAKAAQLIVAGVLALGVAVEVVELYAGESVSGTDIAMNLVAGLCGLAASFVRAPGIWPGRAIWLGVTVSLLGVAGLPFALVARSYVDRNASFPVLLDAGRGADLDWVRSMPSPVQIGQVGDLQSGGRRDRVFIVPLDQGSMPGLAIDEPYSDWRGFDTLVIDLINPGDSPLELILNVDDMRGSGMPGDRYDETVHLAPRSRKVIRTSFETIRRSLPHRRFAFEDMDIVMLYRSGAAAGERVLVRKVWLE